MDARKELLKVASELDGFRRAATTPGVLTEEQWDLGPVPTGWGGYEVLMTLEAHDGEGSLEKSRKTKDTIPYLEALEGFGTVRSTLWSGWGPWKKGIEIVSEWDESEGPYQQYVIYLRRKDGMPLSKEETEFVEDTLRWSQPGRHGPHTIRHAGRAPVGTEVDSDGLLTAFRREAMYGIDDEPAEPDEGKLLIERELRPIGRGGWWDGKAFAINEALLAYNMWRFTLLPYFAARTAYRPDLNALIIQPNWTSLDDGRGNNISFSVGGGWPIPEKLGESAAEYMVRVCKSAPTIEEIVRAELRWVEKTFGIQIPASVEASLIREAPKVAVRRWRVNRLRLKNRAVPLDGSKPYDLDSLGGPVRKSSVTAGRAPVGTEVVTSCDGERVDSDDVKFINIEEDQFGADVMTFKCPKCRKTHRSNVYKSRW